MLCKRKEHCRECHTYLKDHKGGPNMVIKLDMIKAYDRVSWRYLMHVLRAMRFAEHFINMVWSSLANNLYLVLINGQASRFLKSSIGVKQGDPLFPCVKQGDPLFPSLFILYADVLSRSLNKLFED